MASDVDDVCCCRHSSECLRLSEPRSGGLRFQREQTRSHQLLKNFLAHQKSLELINPNRHCLELICLLTSRPHLKVKRPNLV